MGLNGSSSPPTVSAQIISETVDATEQNGPTSSHSLVISKGEPSSVSVQAILDRAADEGLDLIQSPRVGFFRRSRTIKGKKAPPPCNEVITYVFLIFFFFLCDFSAFS
ncbi:uncharacterized protein [Rutidosis leptorrhynchoides]|uniref:uncharacterized protein n=1 Tax=Rutidosis leptorrhynchoides TaxID=125765 RepID=UPI003A99EDF9